MSSQPSPEELEETKKSLSAILANDDIFQRVLDAVFDSMDKDENGSLDSTELHAYIVGSAEGLGVAEAPSAEQVDGIFKHLDLDSDRRVSKDELAVFLKHLFQQQLRQCELSLGRHR